MSTDDDVPSTDETDVLAALLGVTARAFADAFGAEWTISPVPPDHDYANDYDADPSGGLDGPVTTPWHVSGTPAQLMLQVFQHGVVVAIPEGRWTGGAHDLEFFPGEQTYVPGEAVESTSTAQLVSSYLHRRRSRFRYCRYCRQVTGPEQLVGGTCMGCASRWEGLVF